MGRKNKRKNVYVKPITEYKYISRYGVSGSSYNNHGENGQVTKNQRPKPQPRRGDIWFVRLGNHYGSSIQGGTRPVLIISNDQANRHSETFTAIPMTLSVKRMDLPIHVELGARFCEKDKGSISELAESSMLLVEQLTTVGSESLMDRIGRLDDENKLAEIERAIEVQTGIRAPEQRKAQERWTTPGQRTTPVQRKYTGTAEVHRNALITTAEEDRRTEQW